MKFSKSPPSVRHQAPLLGADNDAILAELGYSRDEVDLLRTAGCHRRETRIRERMTPNPRADDPQPAGG